MYIWESHCWKTVQFRWYWECTAYASMPNQKSLVYNKNLSGSHSSVKHLTIHYEPVISPPNQTPESRNYLRRTKTSACQDQIFGSQHPCMHIKQPYSYATLRMAFPVNPVSEIFPNLDSPRGSVDLQICILNTEY